MTPEFFAKNFMNMRFVLNQAYTLIADTDFDTTAVKIGVWFLYFTI